MQAGSLPATRWGSYPQYTSRCSPAVGSVGGKAPPGLLWRRRLALWGPGSDFGRDPHRGRRASPTHGAVSAPGGARMPTHLLLEWPRGRRRRGASLAAGLGSRCVRRSWDRRDRESETFVGEGRMPPLGLVRCPRQAAVQVGCTTLRMALARRGSSHRRDTRRRPAGGLARSSLSTGRRRVPPGSSPSGEGPFGTDPPALAVSVTAAMFWPAQNSCGSCMRASLTISWLTLSARRHVEPTRFIPLDPEGARRDWSPGGGVCRRRRRSLS
jgi:hypothetical protein